MAEKPKPIQTSGPWSSVLKAIQGNFDRLQGWYDHIVARHNALVDDVEELADVVQGVAEHTNVRISELDQTIDGFSPTSHGHDHGSLTGLSDDDHTQYVLEATAHLRGTVELLNTIRPSISGNQDNWNPTGLSTANIVRVTFSGPGFAEITGLAGGTDGRTLLLFVEWDSYPLTLKHDVTSTAANRFFLPLSQDLDLDSGEGVLVVWDDNEDRWTVLGRLVLATPSSNSVFITADVVGAGSRDSGTSTAAARANHKHEHGTGYAGGHTDSGSDGSDHDILEHADANTSPSPTDGDVLTWDDMAGEWVAAAPTGGATEVHIKEGGSAEGDVATLDFDDSDFNVTVAASEADISLNYGTGAGQPAEGNHTHAGATIAVEENDVSVDTAVTTLDFQNPFDVTSDGADEVNISLDQSELDFGEDGDVAAVGSSNSAGASNELARADHVHSGADSDPDDGDTAPFSYKGFKTAALYLTSNQSINNTTYTTLSGFTEDWDGDNIVSESSGTFTPSAEGLYIIMVQVQWPKASTNNYRHSIRKGSTVISHQHMRGHALTASDDNRIPIFAMAYFNGSSDTFDIRVRQDTGGAVNVQGGQYKTRVFVMKCPRPSIISKTVAALTINNGATGTFSATKPDYHPDLGSIVWSQTLGPVWKNAGAVLYLRSAGVLSASAALTGSGAVPRGGLTTQSDDGSVEGGSQSNFGMLSLTGNNLAGNFTNNSGASRTFNTGADQWGGGIWLGRRRCFTYAFNTSSKALTANTPATMTNIDLLAFNGGELDTHRATLAAGVITVNRTGKYLIQARSALAQTASSRAISIIKNNAGTPVDLGGIRHSASATSGDFSECFVVADLTAGDTVEMVMNVSTNSTYTTSGNFDENNVGVHMALLWLGT